MPLINPSGGGGGAGDASAANQTVTNSNLSTIAGAVSTAANQATEITALNAIVTKLPAPGQTTMAASQPVTLASNQSTLPVATQDIVATGNITTQNLVPAGVATASSAVTVTALTGMSTATVQVTGTYTGALSAQATVDGTNWVTMGGVPFININTGASTATIASATVSVFQLDISGFKQFRITGLAAMTGTATVSIQASAGVGLVGLDSPLPTGANVIGALTANQSVNVAQVAGVASTLNAGAVAAGTQRVVLTNDGSSTSNPLNPVVSTTGDTGAKTTTFNGATQTNTNAPGANIVFNVGAVTGTTPTMVCKLQGSADGGTTWYDLPGATTASLVATGVFGIQLYPGLGAVAGTTVSGTTATVNGLLPKTWRVVYTIGGTTPSFTLTNVQVAYNI